MARCQFSIVIPTKNRSFLVENSIKSSLQQSFSDLEIILVDNDDTDDTNAVVRKYQDPRLRYFRTGNLSMYDNWEFGIDQASGNYVLILADKSALKKRALETIGKWLQKMSAEVISWPMELFNDTFFPPVVYRGAFSGSAKIYSPDELLNMFMKIPRGQYETKLPRGLNSCLHRDLIAKIKMGPLRRLCPPPIPDYSMNFLTLKYANKILNIEDHLAIYGSCKESVGGQSFSKNFPNKIREKELGSSDANKVVDKLPLKLLMPSTVIYNTFLKIREIEGGCLNNIPFNMAQLFLVAHDDIQLAKSLGHDMSTAEDAWKKTLCQQSPEIQKTVSKGLSTHNPSTMEKLKTIGRIFKLHIPWRIAKKAFGISLQSSPIEPMPSFSSVLDYIEWEDREFHERHQSRQAA